jgi:hypothetical protein
MKSACLAIATLIVFSAGSEPVTLLASQAQVSPAYAGEVSAARKKVPRKAVTVDSRSPYYLRPGVKPSFGYIGPPGYAGEYAWRKSIGQCVEDLGYGRWSPCGQR